MANQPPHRQSVEKLAQAVSDELSRQARRDLDSWARIYRQRDRRIVNAAACGVGVNEITRRTGLAKTTVLRILDGAAPALVKGPDPG